MKSHEYITIVLGFIDLFGVSMLITCLPSHIKSQGLSGVALGIFLSSYGAIQLFSSPIMGHLADRLGHRRVLSICSLCSAVGYAVMGVAPNLQMMVFGRILTGVFKHSQTISRAIVSSSVAREERDTAMGYFSAISVLGFIVGPPIGGWLFDKYGFASVALTCAGMFVFISGVHLILSIVDNTAVEGRHKSVSSFDKEIFKRLWDVYFVQALMASAVLLFRTNFSITMKTRFGADVTTTGLITSSGALTGFAAGLVSGRIIGFYNSQYLRILTHTTCVQISCILGCAFAPTLPAFVVMQLPLSFVNNVARESTSGLILSRADKSIPHGKIFGVSQSLLSFCRLIVPFIWSVVNEWNSRAPALFGATFATAALFIFLLKGNEKKHIE